MEFHVTPDVADARRAELVAAATALAVDEDRLFPPPGAAERAALARFLADNGIEFFSIDEVVTPHRPAEASQAGFSEFVPPRHLWPWTLLVLVVADELRRAVGAPVVLRNLWRPMSYNELVASSGIRSDHPNACAVDLDFRSVDHRRTAETAVRDLHRDAPELALSLGLGKRTLHVGVLSPKGSRHWFYDSYDDPRMPLSDGAGTATRDEAGDGDAASSDGPAPVVDDQPGSSRTGGAAAARPLDDEVLRLIIRETAVHESGGRFDAMNRDGEFEGRFNRPDRPHAAFGRYHIGLSYGIVQFTQDSGTLGELLTAMRDRDPATFSAIFGPSSDDLVEVTTRSGPPSKDSPPRGPRLAPVDGADLWEEPWTTRFARAADHEPFREVQLDMAEQIYLRPMLRFADWVGLDSDRALAMVFDRSVQLGRGGARRFIMDAVGPIDDDRDLLDALAGYGFADLRDFQRSVPGLAVDGDFGPWTHAALCAFERRRSDDEPFVLHVPERDEMLEMLVVASAGRRFEHRMQRLLTTDAFDDLVLDLT